MSLITLSQLKDLATRAQAYTTDVANTIATALESLITRVETLEEASNGLTLSVNTKLNCLEITYTDDDE